jgi:hypothetical protein
MAAAPAPLGLGRTAALGAFLLGAACVLALAVAGLPSRVGTPPVSHSVSGALGYVVVAAISMGFVVSLGLAAGARARARRERRVPGLRLPFLQRPLLLALIATAIAAPVLMVALPFRSAHITQTRTPPRTQMVQTRTSPAPASSDRVHWPSLAAAAVGAALALLVIALIVRGEVNRSAAAEESEFAPAIDAGIDAFESETDPRRGVIRAYAAMERALGERGLGRHVAETPVEYLTRVLARVEAGAAAAARLTSLYERAKFSPHQIDESSRQDALAALRTLRASGGG